MLAHLWHRPFRIEEKCVAFQHKLKIAGTPYRFHSWADVSWLKSQAAQPSRPVVQPPDVQTVLTSTPPYYPKTAGSQMKILVSSKSARSWCQVGAGDAYVAVDMQVPCALEELESPDWDNQSQLDCGRQLYEFDSSARAKSRFAAIRSGTGALDLA